MKISSREKTLLGVALFVILAAVFYFYVFLPTNDDYQAIKTEIAALKDEDIMLASELKSEAQYDATIKESQTAIDAITDRLYTKTLQEKFIRKIQDMCFESGIKFNSTTYPIVSTPLSAQEGIGGVNLKSYLEAEFLLRQATEATTDSDDGSTLDPINAAKVAANDNYTKFSKTVNLTSVAFKFKGTYAQVHKFVEIMEKNIKDENRLVVCNTMKLSQIDKDKSENGFYSTYGFSLERPAWMLPEDTEQEYDVDIEIYFYMTNSPIDFGENVSATE